MLTLTARFLKSMKDAGVASESLVRCWVKYNGCTFEQLQSSWLWWRLSSTLIVATIGSGAFVFFTLFSVYKDTLGIGHWAWVPFGICVALLVCAIASERLFSEFLSDAESLQIGFCFGVEHTSEESIPPSFRSLETDCIYLIDENERKMDNVSLEHDERAEAVNQRKINKQKVRQLKELRKKFTGIS